MIDASPCETTSAIGDTGNPDNEQVGMSAADGLRAVPNSILRCDGSCMPILDEAG